MMDSLLVISRLYILAVAYNLTMLVLVAWCYAETFSLIMYPLSWLGKVTLDSGAANKMAAVLFSAGTIFNMYFWKKMLDELAKTSMGKKLPVKILGCFVFYGFLLLALPCDVFVLLHSIGGGLLVGGLWALTAWLLYYAKNVLGRFNHLLLQLTLHSTALYCFYHFLLDSELKGFSQKPLLLAITFGSGASLNTLLQARYGLNLMQTAFVQSYKY
ncbi:MAG: hypothetical protein GX167_00475 [Firmicutes bacterium]|nr:hypothetical protein [Bacillota bacterium]